MDKKEYIEKRVFLDFVDQQIKNKYGVGYMLGEPFRKDIMKLPAADVVEVVRCRDCIHRYSSEYCECRPKDGFCNDGERSVQE